MLELRSQMRFQFFYVAFNCIFCGICYLKLPSNIIFIYTSHRLSLRNRMVSFATPASSTLTHVDQRQEEEKY